MYYIVVINVMILYGLIQLINLFRTLSPGRTFSLSVAIAKVTVILSFVTFHVEIGPTLT